ncbi:uncharacterized protein LOC127123720 [Lathyrus oleraceus]|uniref:uncharacterized protein LOC127123720 n=1 Tax=Pisum sativum TaxID=3888 RepID=UPI0021D37EAD|nr:uncharacterized protein LOC127123720 [Pisum sativum]
MRKKQLKLQGAPAHQKTKSSASKRPHAQKTLGAESEPKSKKTPKQMESDSSSPGIEDPKAATGSPQHPTVTSIIVTIQPKSSRAPTYHPITPPDSDKGSMDEVNDPAVEKKENSPPKIITQHSHTSGSELEDEKNEDAPLEKDAGMQDPREIPEDGSEDGSPETNQDLDDPDNEEEEDQSMFNFDEEPMRTRMRIQMMLVMKKGMSKKINKHQNNPRPTQKLILPTTPQGLRLTLSFPYLL